MFLLNSCLSLFSAATSQWHPFSRSYGVILPSSLTMLLPSALGFSPHPPVSVFGTGTQQSIAAFLDASSLCFATFLFAPLHALGLYEGFASRTPLSLAPVFPLPAQSSLTCPHSSVLVWYRNLHLFSIDYVFRPRLRPRLTQGRSALPWNPWIFGRKDSHLTLATHSGILSSHHSTTPSGMASLRWQCSPTNVSSLTLHSFGAAF